MSKSDYKFKAVIFDLGNVLIDVDFKKCFDFWGKELGLASEYLAKRFVTDKAYDQHERGEITGQEYALHVQKQLGVNFSYETFIEGWNSILGEPIEASIEFTNQYKDSLDFYCLTNSNEIHRPVWTKKYQEDLKHIKQIFCSSQMRARKPESRAFQIVLREASLNPKQVIFVDDLAQNIQGAKSCSIQGLLFSNPQESINELKTRVLT